MLDWYTPENWQSLSLSDYDLGTTGAAFVPGPNLVMTGNKYGTFYVADPASMGHLSTVTDSPQNLQAVRWGGRVHLRALSEQQRAELFTCWSRVPSCERS